MHSLVRRHCESTVLCPKTQHNDQLDLDVSQILTIKSLLLGPPSRHHKTLLGCFCVSVIFFLGLSFMLLIKTIYIFSSSVVTLKASLLQNSTKIIIIIFHTFIFFWKPPSFTGTFDAETGMCILDNSTDHYLVVHPDTLVSGTTVSMATKCLRQSILNERFRTEGQSEAMLIGTLLHDLFDLAMEFNG